MILSQREVLILTDSRKHSEFHWVNLRKITTALLFCLPMAWQPVLANDPDLQATLDRMQDLLEQQQEQLDEQRKELAAQRLLIRQLQGKSQVQTAQETADVPDVVYPETDPTSATAKQADPDAPLPTEDQSGQQQAVQALVNQQVVASATKEKKEQEQTEIAHKAFYDPSNTIYDPNFPGAWYLPGTTAAMKVGGYVNLSVVNSFDPMLIPDRFIVGSIPPAGVSVAGAEEGTQVSAQQTRINLEYREQTTQGEIRAFVEGDFQGDSDGFRLRHAFGQFRSILAGKTWSTFVDIDSLPEEVDVEGINGQVLLRHSQVRWSPQFGENLKLKLALEDPSTDIFGGQGQRGAFDLVASLDKMPFGKLGLWNYRVGFVLRDLKATESTGEPELTGDTKSTTGWGITTGGRQPISWWSSDDYLLWQLTYGKGIGHYINDLGTVGGGDAVFDPDGKLQALPVFSGYLSYLHRWPLTWRFVDGWPGAMRSSITFSWVDINNFDYQNDTAYNQTLRASINLIYNPTKNIQGGVEYLWGQRQNKDGSKGTATQLQFAMRYLF
jgi:hypothetical protein